MLGIVPSVSFPNFSPFSTHRLNDYLILKNGFTLLMSNDFESYKRSTACDDVDLFWFNYK